MNRRSFLVQSGSAFLAAPTYARLTRTSGVRAVESATRIVEWERGIALESRTQKDMAMFLWFYEWNMFDAIRSGEHTIGRFEDFQRSVSSDGSEASVHNDQLQLAVKATDTGAELRMQVTNKSDHDWSALAAIIPCFSPGKVGGNLRERRGSAEGLLPPRNPEFANEKTFFLSNSGLELLQRRQIHFNGALRPQIDAATRNGPFVFSEKWPTAAPDAAGGIMMRESNDGLWVSGVAWDDFLSVQGHNPWQCMHLAPRVGPMKQNETKTMRGRLYLFKGTKDECLQRYRADFA